MEYGQITSLWVCLKHYFLSLLLFDCIIYLVAAVRTGGEGMGGVSLLLIERTMPGVSTRYNLPALFPSFCLILSSHIIGEWIAKVLHLLELLVSVFAHFFLSSPCLIVIDFPRCYF